MDFVFYSNLKPGAKKAFDRGNGKYRKYTVFAGTISVTDQNGFVRTLVVISNKSRDKSFYEEISSGQ